MQVMVQASHYIFIDPQGKWIMTAPIISFTVRDTHHNELLLSCAFLLNLPKTSPFQRVLWGMKGMYSELQVMSQAWQSTVIHQQSKWIKPAAIVSFMDRGTHHNMSFLSCELLLNVPKTSPSAVCYVVWKGCILTCGSCPKLPNPLSCIHKANVTGQ